MLWHSFPAIFCQVVFSIFLWVRVKRRRQQHAANSFDISSWTATYSHIHVRRPPRVCLCSFGPWTFTKATYTTHDVWWRESSGRRTFQRIVKRGNAGNRDMGGEGAGLFKNDSYNDKMAAVPKQAKPRKTQCCAMYVTTPIICSPIVQHYTAQL